MPTPATPITAGPAVPSSATPEGTFDAAYEAFNTWERDELAPKANANAQASYDNVVEAIDAAAVAIAQAAAAQALVNVDKWVAGTDYSADETAWSPANKQTYRRNVGGISNTDPSLDLVGWTRVGGGDAVPQFFFNTQGII